MFESDLWVVEEMCLSLRLKKNLMRGTQLLFVIRREDEEEEDKEEEGAKNDDGISTEENWGKILV